MSALGHKRGAPTHVRFTPDSDRKSEFPQKAVSALPPKADMCSATNDVGYGPKADHRALFIRSLHRRGQAGWPEI